jgi:hypothetical protein
VKPLEKKQGGTSALMGKLNKWKNGTASTAAAAPYADAG